MEGMEQFKDLWVQTARERVQTLGDLLLKLEKSSDDKELIDELMRAGHSLKGESGAMGFQEIATLAHVIEDLFTGIGNGNIKMTPEIISELLAAVDRISEGVDNVESGAGECNCQESVENLKKLTGLKTEGFGKTDKSQEVVEESNPIAEVMESKDNIVENTDASLRPADPVKNESELAKEEVPQALADSPQASSATMDASTAKVDTAKQVSTVTLKIEKLDQLLSANEELVLLKMKLRNNQIVQNNTELKAEIHQLDRLVTDMQFHLMQARLFPISLALHTLPRLVRDTALKTGKQVRLDLEGEDTTVDRTIIDHLTEPFVHMIRNSVDHGLELPEERKKQGKPEEGVIKLKAYTKENKFYCEVSDDGRGVEWDILARKAVQEGKFTKEEVQDWSDKDKEQLLFMDGLSASQEVTDISGRGVGLGAVREAIKKLGGNVSVLTEVGKGTTFTLRLPMTLAIMQALLVRIGDQTFAMPSHEIARSIQIQENDIKSSGNMPMIVVDKGYVPLINLIDKFGLGSGIKKDDDTLKKDLVTKINNSGELPTGTLTDLFNNGEETKIPEL
ncbi:MAG: CheW domain protein [candidate division CPR2 bacterium GW2011_GWD2_39_7]|nr:MAG: CheW domain protein [candidate division CPR2 bacterium GW2011_GWD2_39_7]